MMKVLEVLPLGPKSKLVAVQLGEKILVVGSGEDRVSTVAELDPSQVGADGDLLEPSAGVPFKEHLLKLVRK
jgi:flagellar biogenesis protein FliO